MTDQSDGKRILALDVHARSFGFVVFEGPNYLIDWGVRCFRTGANAPKVPAGEKLAELLDQFRPSAIVVRKPEPGRYARKTRTLTTIQRRALSQGVPVRFVSRADVERAFVGFESNKHEVAAALAKQFPSLAPRLPPERKSWQSEDYRMGIFDAAAVGVAYFVRYKG